MLADKLPDAANLAAGALFFGQFLADRTFSLTLAFAGLGTSVALMAWAIVLASEEPTIVTGIVCDALGGMVLFASIVGILDLIGRHHRHREQKH